MAKGDNGESDRSIFGSDASDPNNSLLKKVTKRVSGLLPSSLTKWFGDGQQSVVRRRESVDDENEDTAQLLQPPKKRAKPSSDTDFAASSSFTITNTPVLNSRSDNRHLQPGPSGYTRYSETTTSRSYEATSAQNEVTVANGDEKSDSGDSTSGYSSVQPQQRKESSFISDRGNSLNQPSTSKTSPNTSLNASLNSSRSLFSEQSLNPQRQCMSARRPSFSASTFGSPSFVDRTLSTKRAVNSPFYSGRTIYGGASAYRRNRIIFPRDETNNIAARNSVDIKPVKDATPNNDSVSLSKTARRILDTLEHFSTPVLDAKKIPNINRLSCDTSRRTPYKKVNKSVPNKELLVPTVPDLIKMKLKERLQDSTVQVRKVAVGSKSILNTEYSIPAVEESSRSQKHVNKMKTKIVSVRERKEVNDTVDAVILPEVKLPITSLPKFDFTLPPPATASKPTETKKPAASAPISATTRQIKAFSRQFHFAKPIIVSEKPKSKTSTDNFIFSKPENCRTNTTTSTFTFNVPSPSTAPRRKDMSKNNGQNNVGFSLQPAAQFVAGSVMDILGKPEKKPESNNLIDKFKPAVGTWECNTCMVRNIPSATRCLACETLREPPKKIEEQSCGFGNKFKILDKWECSVCMVRNNNADTKCAACTTPKHGAPPASAAPLNSSSGFGDKFKPTPDTWECSVCMIRNKNGAVKCVACETPKPGTKSEIKLIMPLEVKTNNSGFGDLIKKQQTNWECPSCMVRNATDKKSCVCCEAPKPGEQQEIKLGTTQFKFGIDNSTSSGFKFGVETTTPPFSFGIKPAEKNTTDVQTVINNGPAPVTTGFTFGVVAVTKSDAESQPIPEPPVNKYSTFGAPVETNKSAAFKFDSPITTTVNNTISGYTFGVPSSATQTTPTKPTFSFGAASTTATTASAPSVVSSIASIKPNTNIFGVASVASVGQISQTTNVRTVPSVPSVPTVPTVPTLPTVPAVSTVPTVPTTNSSTYNFGQPVNAKPVTFGADKLPTFNFGSGLPFNPVYPTPKNTTAPTTSVGFGSSSTSKTEAFVGKQSTFTFSTGSKLTNNNKSAVKPFSFSGSGEPAAKTPAFSFSQSDTPTPLAKAPVFNFAASSSGAAETAVPPANMFSFSANKSEKPVSFGAGNAPAPTPQNGGFSFGSNSVPLNFNFGAGNNPQASQTPAAVFGFGSSQAGSGSAVAAPAPVAPASGIFTFGGGAPGLQQTPTFSPDIKPNFNFTGGSLPNFTAQTAPSAGAMPQRKIRKAVRRTQPR